MKRQTLIVGLLLSFVFLAACQSEEEKLRSVMLNYLKAQINYSAPQNAFIYLSDVDQAFTTTDKFAKEFPSGKARPDATFKILSVQTNADLKKVKVEISEAKETETQTFLLRKNRAGKYRVVLGLAEVAEIRKELDKAKRLLKDGALDDARSLVEQISSKPFHASHAEIYDKEINEVRGYIKRFSLHKDLDRRIGNALKKNLKDLKIELKELNTLIPKDDEGLVDSYSKLKDAYAARYKTEAIENFLITKIRVKTVSANWGFVKEASFTAINNTKREVSELVVKLTFQNEGKDIDETTLSILKKGKILGIDKELVFKKTFKTPPELWDGKEIKLQVEDLRFTP